MLGPFLTRIGREHANDTFRLHAPRRHEFHCRKGSPRSLLLYSQLGIQADGLVLRTSSWLVPSWKMLILGPKRRVRVVTPFHLVCPSHHRQRTAFCFSRT